MVDDNNITKSYENMFSNTAIYIAATGFPCDLFQPVMKTIGVQTVAESAPVQLEQRVTRSKVASVPKNTKGDNVRK